MPGKMPSMADSFAASKRASRMESNEEEYMLRPAKPAAPAPSTKVFSISKSKTMACSKSHLAMN
jgi:hypothetical protein